MFLIPPSPPALVAQTAGPPSPALKGAAPRPRTFSVARATTQTVREMAGAVVVVEDDATLIAPSQPVLLRSPRLNLGLFDFSVRFSPNAHPNGSLWTDPSGVLPPNEPAQKMYPIGWGYN